MIYKNLLAIWSVGGEWNIVRGWKSSNSLNFVVQRLLIEFSVGNLIVKMWTFLWLLQMEKSL